MAKKWENIIIHCSDSEFGSAVLIDNWHREKGWSGIGYHFVIQNGYSWNSEDFWELLEAQVEPGRPCDLDIWVEANEIGAHALGFNTNSIGICMIGKDDFAHSQFLALKFLVEDLMGYFNISKEHILGHCDTAKGKAQGKTCPNFSVVEFLDEYDVGLKNNAPI